MNEYEINYKNLVSFKIKKRSEINRGFVLEYNDEWTLLIHNVVDFVIDGYLILNNKYIKGYRQSEEEYFLSEVIKTKYPNFEKPNHFDIINLFDSLQQVEVIQLEFKNESKCFVGKIMSFDDKVIRFKHLNPDGAWENEISVFQISKIRIIRIKNDYVETLYLYSKTLGSPAPN